MRTLAVARYLGSDVLRGQRFLVPLLAYGGVLAVLFGGDPGPPPSPWAASTLLLYPVAAWVAVLVAHTEEPEQRLVTVAGAGGPDRVVAGTLLVALLGGVLLTAMAVVAPLLRGGYPYPPPTLLAGACAHLAAAGTGVAVGLLCARPVLPRIGATFLLAVTVVGVTAVQPWLPPVGSAVLVLTRGGLPLAEALAGAGAAVAAAAVVAAVARRR